MMWLVRKVFWLKQVFCFYFVFFAAMNYVLLIFFLNLLYMVILSEMDVTVKENCLTTMKYKHS